MKELTPTPLSEQIGSSRKKKKKIPENRMSVDYPSPDPWISVLGGGIQVEKNVISLYVQGEASAPLQLNYTFLLS